MKCLIYYMINLIYIYIKSNKNVSYGLVLITESKTAQPYSWTNYSFKLLNQSNFLIFQTFWTKRINECFNIGLLHDGLNLYSIYIKRKKKRMPKLNMLHETSCTLVLKVLTLTLYLSAYWWRERKRERDFQLYVKHKMDTHSAELH